ncbi:competence/damage-inducible protein A [Jatrophihabitans endophyticus]|uniref:competence/damage-inducible protein A n=1 Tax=Jatrophihabitans endophyticus TaxID=1206085 RepID=UPI0019EAF023|nr:competence/damage-inducible protein A [Jatrophihabitans endophyticus]MBE7189567.1 competence/damage-inducible protein A [Jatrophihabitans endophyticus]
MAPRAGIVVTGTEVLTGRVTDRNGPWLAEQLRAAGIDVAQVVVVGDRPDDLRDALRFCVESGVALVLTSGGLGPTADDLTAEVVAGFQGRTMSVDTDLDREIAGIVERISRNRGWQMDPEATAAATRKQATVPDGAAVLAPVGTAPGLVVPATGDGPPVVVLPGPPRELQGMWPAVLADPTVRAAVQARSELRQATIRLWGPPESELSASLRRHDGEFDGLEITTCLRSGELEVVSRYAPEAQPAQDRLGAALAADFGDQLFSPDGASIDEIVAAALLDGGLTIATAESCTAGLLAGRLTDLAGSSAYVLGGLVTYSDEAKTELAGVPAELVERLGAVSAEVAVAMAEGARRRLGTDVGVGITGVAGPGGGTPEKPVGLVHLCVSGPNGRLAREIHVPGSRADVRQRTVVVALHMIRTLLTR